MKKWWVGCSGFSYKHWKDRFYPAGLPQRKWFEYYCQTFNAVELNVTFYRYPRLESLKAWYDNSPPGFRFAVKAPRLITHFRKFHDARRQAGDFYSLAAEGLREKLGCVLFQLPPNLVFTPANLENILATLDGSFTNVVEFRHVSWWNERVYSSLRQHRVVFCGISYPGLPDDVVKSAPVVYHRFHGVPRLYVSGYKSATLEGAVEKMKAFRGVGDVYVFFNNDVEVAAVRDAARFAGFVS